MSYRLAEKGVIRLVDGLRITRSMAEWEDYRAWLKAGGVPEPMIATQPPVPTLAELKKRRVQALSLEALAHVQAVMPEVGSMATAMLVRELWLSIAPAARQPTQDMQTVFAIFSAYRSAVIDVRKCSTPECVAAVTPTWP